MVVGKGRVGATLVFHCIANKPDYTWFKSVPVDVYLDSVHNIASRWSISEAVDFAEVDKNDDMLLNLVLWKGLKSDDFDVPPTTEYICKSCRKG
jgi:hypothetical protein